MTEHTDTATSASPSDRDWLTRLSTTRIIVDSDAKNEADDQFAIVHALLTPTFDLRGIIPSHFGTARTERSLEESREEVDLLLRLTGLTGTIPVADGAARALVAPDQPEDCAGARLILEESRRGGGRLFVAVLGPLTTVASALLLDPELAQREVTVVWIGGPPYDDVVAPTWPCFNLLNDRHAANVVFGSGIDVWQIPMDVYAAVSVGYAEYEARVRPQGELGTYLVDQMIAFNRDCHVIPIDGRGLGDSPAVAVVLNPYAAGWRTQEPVRFTEGFTAEPSDRGAPVRVATRIDSRYVLEDFFTKLRLFHEGGWPTARPRETPAPARTS